MAHAAETPVVEFSRLVKVYRHPLFNYHLTRALDGVSFAIPRGQVLGLLGPNRAGKTTLLKILLSICAPTSGTLTRFGLPWHDRRGLARIGYVHENHAFPRYLSAREVLRFYAALGGVSQQAVSHRIQPTLRLVGLADRADEPISRFSKGMVQRLGLAQALMNEPDLLILDEPTEGLDYAGREMFRQIVLTRRESGMTTILVSHDLAEVSRLAERLVVLQSGKIRYDGPTQTFLGDVQRGAESLEVALRRLYTEPGADEPAIPAAPNVL